MRIDTTDWTVYSDFVICERDNKVTIAPSMVYKDMDLMYAMERNDGCTRVYLIVIVLGQVNISCVRHNMLGSELYDRLCKLADEIYA